MNTNSENDQANTAEERVQTKKPYVKPEVRHETVFETLALSCGKTAGGGGGCAHNRSAS